MPRFVRFKLEQAEATGGHLRWVPVAELYLRLSAVRHRVALRRGDKTLIATHEHGCASATKLSPACGFGGSSAFCWCTS